MKSKFILLVFLMFIFVISATQCSPVAVETEPSVAPESSPSSLDGKSLVETKCISCHGMDRIKNQSMDAAAWKSTVERMVEKGAQLTIEEQTIVIDFLAKTYP